MVPAETKHSKVPSKMVKLKPHFLSSGHHLGFSAAVSSQRGGKGGDNFISKVRISLQSRPFLQDTIVPKQVRHQDPSLVAALSQTPGQRLLPLPCPRPGAELLAGPDCSRLLAELR